MPSGWGDEYYYRPYVPVAVRKAKALQEAKKRAKQGQTLSPVVIPGRKITTTFWGNAWSKNLETYSDYANRLPRGMTYVRNGSVIDLQISKGHVTALVMGSELYEITIQISQLDSKIWSKMKAKCSGKIGSLVELLRGKLSQEVMEIVTQKNEGLFPKPAEIKTRCSCPDFAGLCKHLAAVLYGIGSRMDSQPELLFVLRGVDHLELIDNASNLGVSDPLSRNDRTLAGDDLASLFGIEMASEAPASDRKASQKKSPQAAASKSSNPDRGSAATKTSGLPKKTPRLPKPSAKEQTPNALPAPTTDLPKSPTSPTRSPSKSTGNANKVTAPTPKSNRATAAKSVQTGKRAPATAGIETGNNRRPAKKSTKMTTITSPLDGVVLKTDKKSGSLKKSAKSSDNAKPGPAPRQSSARRKSSGTK